MRNFCRELPDDTRPRIISRRQLLRTVGVASIAAPLVERFGVAAALAQGRCMTTHGSPQCVTTDIAPIFAPTGWKTVALDRIVFRVADYRKEAAFYNALMGWTPRTDDGRQAVMDIGDWGTVIFRQAPPEAFAASTAATDARGDRGPVRAVVESFAFVIDKWDAKKVEQELRTRGLSPEADTDGSGYEGFHIKDPDGFDLTIGNGNGPAKSRKTKSTARLSEPAPFEPTGWSTVWLDHFSFGVTDYKKSASFYMNLFGWAPTYDEGSQHELMIGDVGDIIIRGGNPLSPDFGKGGGRSGRGIDHISFGIQPWDTDGVKAALEKRGLRAQVDTSSRHRAPDGTWVPDEIHTAAFKSYHTQTPNGYNLQISYVTHANRLALANAVNPKKVSGTR
jgi:catechol 2,3-dioxygenase-like lactoylglutathione lyase family enzyme